MRVEGIMGEKERAQALHAIMVLSLEVGHRGGLAAPIVALAQKVLDVNNKHREEAESHIRSARNGGNWQGQRGNVVRQAMKRVHDAIEYGDLPPGRKSKEFRRLIDRAKKVLDKAGEQSDFMSVSTEPSPIMGASEPMQERRVQPAAGGGDDNLLASLLDDKEDQGSDGGLIATLMDDDVEEDDDDHFTGSEGQGLRLAPVAGGAEPMSHMDGNGDKEAVSNQVDEQEQEQPTTVVEQAQQENNEPKAGLEDTGGNDQAASQLLALQQQVAELTKAIKHEEMIGDDVEEDFIEEDFIEEPDSQPRTRRSRRIASVAPSAMKETTTRNTASRASPGRRAMAAAPVASTRVRRAEVEDDEEEEGEEEGTHRSSTLDTYRLLLETVWVDDLLDPAEVDLLRRKRVELGIDFETHLKMTREMLGGLD